MLNNRHDHRAHRPRRTPLRHLALTIVNHYDTVVNVQTYPDPRPIGVFDSGLGGLTVVREIQAALPCADVLYFADSAFCPYGNRSDAEIRARAVAITATLIERGASTIVVACNTASSASLDYLRERFTGCARIVGLEPAIKPAVAATKTGHIAALVTPRTAAGERLARLVRHHGHGAGVSIQIVPAPGLADLIEAGTIAGAPIRAILQPLLAPLTARGVDSLVLGCTHYPFAATTIQAVVGNTVSLISSGAAVARRTREVHQETVQADPSHAKGRLSLFTSGQPDRVGAIASALLKVPMAADHLPTDAARGSIH